MKATFYTTDEKNGFSQRRLFCNNAKMDAISTATISDHPINENFAGFGVAITGASCYELSTIQRLLEEAGMEFVTAYDAFSKEAPREDSERIYVIAREKYQEGKSYAYIEE